MTKEWTAAQVAGTLLTWIVFLAGLCGGMLIQLIGGPFYLMLIFPVAAILSLGAILIAKVHDD